MDIFLDKRSYTKLELFKYLSKEKEGLRLEEMEKYLDLSNISIKRSLEELTQDLVQLDKNKIILKKEFSSYILIYQSKNQLVENIDALKLFYLKKSVPFSTMLMILNTPFTSVDNALYNLLISSSYYYKMYKKLKPVVNNWGIDIEFSGKSSNLTGDQFHIRYFLYSFYWNSFKNIDWPFLSFSKKFILSFSSFFDKNMLATLNSSELTRLTYHLAIFFENVIKYKQYIQISSQNKQVMTVFKEVHDLSPPLVQMIKESKMIIHENILENERLYFNFITRLSSTTLDSDIEKIKIGKKLVKLNNPIIEYCETLLTSIIKDFNLTYTSDKYHYLMYLTTIYCISNTTLDIDYHIFTKNHPTKEKIGISKRKAKKITEKIRSFSKKFSTDNPNKTIAKKMFRYPEIFYNYIYFIVLYLDAPQLSVFINYSKNIHSETLIKKKILDTLSQDTLKIVNNIHEADVVLSDCNEDMLKTDDSFYFIDDITEIETWINLINFLLNLLMQKNFYL